MGSGGAQGSHGPSVCREEKGQRDGCERLVPLLLALQLGEGPRGKEHGRRPNTALWTP